MVLPAVRVVLLFGLILSGVPGDNLNKFDRLACGERRLANSGQTHCRAVRREPNEKRADQLVRPRAARDQRIAGSKYVVYLAVAQRHRGRDEHAFLWKHGRMIDLGTMGGAISVAFDLNDRDQVVGQSTTASGAVRAFL
jgi:probable HAF family extracellular repeat protein